MARRREEQDKVVSVTDAAPGHSEDLDGRMVRYAWMMSIRIVCFVLAVITPSPWRWLFVVGAVFLPYFAVVMANSQHSTSHKPMDRFTPVSRPEIDTKS